MKLGIPIGKKLKWASDSVYRYQHTVINKTCIECGIAYYAIRRLKPLCSIECKKSRSLKLRPQTYKICKKCGVQFGPVNHLSVKYCSKTCAYKDRNRKKKSIPTKEARNAQRLVKYYIDKGTIVRAYKCEECAKICKTEAAHFDYKEPLKVRFLCRSCHTKWDKEFPKNGSISVFI